MNGYVSYWNEEAKVPWIYNPNTQKMISYDNPESIEIKVNYIKSMGLGGTMFWEFSGDKYGVLLNTVYQTINDTTSVSVKEDKELKDIAINIYPNPASGLIFINSTSKIENIVIFDYTGKLLSSQIPNSKTYQINVSQFKTGLYIVKIETGKGILSKRVFIE
jgi:hypothetical protein